MEPLTPVQSATTPPLSPTVSRSQRRLGSPASSLRSPLQRSPDMRSPRSQRVRYSLEAQKAPEEPDKRLVIRKLVLINYKSYAGRQEVGPFNESFTAVVGPNGSGKSNVIDSLLFVFGFRAKKMRQEKLTGLIHTSETHPNLPFCRVEVHFEEVGVPDSGLVLAREVRRDGNNFYALNDKRASYSQVQELLEQRGIDLRHKRFLILQGEVESIALMPPKAEGEGSDGLLEYLEDIIGTSNYKVRIEELDGETEIQRQDCGEKQRRLDIVSKDLDKLDAERAEIEKWMLNANRATIARSKLLQLVESRLRNALDLANGDVEEQATRKKDAEQEIAAKRDQLAGLESKCNEDGKRLDELRKEQAATQVRLKAAHVALVKREQRRGQLEARKKKLERNLRDAQIGRSRSGKSIEDAQADLVSLQSKLESINEREKSARAALTEVQAKVSAKTGDVQAELDELQARVDPWRVSIAEKEQNINAAKADAEAAENVHHEVNERLQQCEKVARSFQEEGRLTDSRVKELESARTLLVNESTKVDGKIPELETAMRKVSETLAQLRPEVAQARESRAASQSQNRIERELLSLKIPGLYGRLGSLGSIDQRYDVAVSTAGPELNNFVVDSVETAKACISALRRLSIGRAKFMVLSKLATPPPSRPDQYPAPRLIDLVKPVDPQFGKAFYAALNDTLVVANIEEANRVAFHSGRQRHRVVTLNGVVVNVSGKMSGGGKPLRGLMARVASSISAEDLERIEKQVVAHELEQAELTQQLSTLRARREKLQAELPKTETALNKDTMSLGQIKAQFARAKEQRRELREEVKKQQEAVEMARKASEERIAQLRSEISELEAQSRSTEESIQVLQKRILDAGGNELRELNSRVRDCEIEDEATRKRIEEIQENIAQHQSRTRKYDEQIESSERELAAFNDTVSDEEPLESISELEASVQSLGAQVNACSTDIDDTKGSISDLRVAIDEFRAVAVEAQNVLDGLRDSTRKMTRSLEEACGKRAELQLYDMSVARNLTSRPPEVAPQAVTDLTQDRAPPELDEDAAMIDADEPALDALAVAIPELSPDEIDDLHEPELKAELAKYERACENGGADMAVLEQYRSRHAEFIERKAVSDDAVASYERVKNEVQRLRKRRYTEFMDGFLQISAKLKEMYQLLTMGGNAELELVDTMDPFAEGILFSVMPPKKSWRNIANLSGGEKTLSSLALVFALHHYKPTPLYVMDEIDAALDFRNVSIIANYIKERTKNGQFIVISLRNNMFELASRLVGVYKVNNMTSSVTLQTE